MDADGDPDLLTAHDDNADLSHEAKAYHGIRLFLNNGRYEFTEAYFYPLFGASMLEVADFDGDNDLDIAAIAYCSEPERPDEGFVLLKNEGQFRFRPQTFPTSRQGKWLVMDAADWDADGDVDLVLGGFLKAGLGLGQRHRHPDYSVLLLENIGSRPSR